MNIGVVKKVQALQSTEEFNQLIKQDTVIAMFTADWCPDCHVIDPILPEIQEAFPSFLFISIDRDQFIELAQEYDIFGIPSFIAFQKGQEIDRFVSKDRKTKDEITQFLNQLP